MPVRTYGEAMVRTTITAITAAATVTVGPNE